VLADQWTDAAGAWQSVLAQASRLEPRQGLKAAFGALFDRMTAHPLMMLLAIHESMSGWKALPQATLGQVPAEIRALTCAVSGNGSSAKTASSRRSI